ncbi:MAG: hypothetical protein KTR14_02380 [Vampirovibrio sp.]|nr:hypothetical protein [Vampirovibrio sp.]
MDISKLSHSKYVSKIEKTNQFYQLTAKFAAQTQNTKFYNKDNTNDFIDFDSMKTGIEGLG